MYDPSVPLRFIHIKKNGGTTVYKFLRKNGIVCKVGSKLNTEKVAGEHSFANQYTDEDSFKFCVVRNPFTRTVSFYNWIKQKNKKPKTFEEYVKTKYNIGRGQNSWTLQSDYIYNNDYSKLLVDKIFCFETLEKEMRSFFNINSRLPHLNRSTFDDYESYYTDELREIVYNHYKRDFDLLGYPNA